METFSAGDLAAVAGIFALAGFVKGVIGLGLPTVALGFSTAVVGLDAAIALMVVPSLVTNLWQAGQGGRFRELLGRFWPMFAAVVAATLIGGYLAAGIGDHYLAALLGALTGIYGLIGLIGRIPSLTDTLSRRISPAVGAVNGILTGLTGSFVFPGVMYLQASGLPRDSLIQAMGMLFSVSSAALMASVWIGGRTTAELGLLSLAALVPVAAGMALGMRVRRHLPEARFRRIFFSSLVLLGNYILIRAWF